MQEININSLMNVLGNALTSAPVENLLNEIGVKRRPYLDENDIEEGRYSLWLPIKKLGLELGFKSQAVFEQCNEEKVTQTPLLLTSCIFYAHNEGMKIYPYALPYHLSFEDSPIIVQEKMKNEKATHKEYIRDVWVFDTHKLIVGYNEKRTAIVDIVYMLVSPYVNPQDTAIFDTEKAVALFGEKPESEAMKKLLNFFDINDFMTEQNEVTDRYLIREYGLSVAFTDAEDINSLSQKGKVFAQISLFDKCYLDFSHGYNGKLPFGLEFSDSPYEFVNKVPGTPMEISEHESRMEGYILWTFSSYCIEIVYSLLTNSIARIHISPLWLFSDEDKNDWSIDKDTLLSAKLKTNQSIPDDFMNN